MKPTDQMLLGEIGRVRERLAALHTAFAAVARADAAALPAALAHAHAEQRRIGWSYRSRLEQALAGDEAADASDKRDVETLSLLIEAAQAAWADQQPPSLRGAAATAEQLTAALRKADLMLLPGALSTKLDSLNVGDSRSLTTLAEPDLAAPDAARVLADAPREYPAVVDGTRGLVYRTAKRRQAQVLLCLTPLGALIGGVIVLWVFGHLDEWTSIDIEQLNSTRGLLEVYALVVFGSVLHLVVSVYKSRRGTAAPAETSDAQEQIDVPSRLLEWAHLRALGLCWSLVPILTTTLVVRLTNLQIEGTEDWAVAILAGYSADSVAQLGFDRLNTAVELFATKTKTTTKT